MADKLKRMAMALAKVSGLDPHQRVIKVEGELYYTSFGKFMVNPPEAAEAWEFFQGEAGKLLRELERK
jgi:hypothetical protein